MELTELLCKTCEARLDPGRAQNNVIFCEHCGNAYILPRKETSPKALSFLRMGEHELDVCKFDDALNAYEKAAEADKTEPEAYFGMALSEFKVQYLKDETADPPHLQPICHEISEKRFTENKNFQRALSLASGAQKEAYEKKGDEIDRIRSEFLRLKESGLDYDCFLCVKVSSEDGGTTQDSHEALKLYHYLKERGYTPFYSEEEIKGRTGVDYEALILYALYTSECMLIVCSNEEYLQTKWVKNEYTRFAKMIVREGKEHDAITFVFRGKPIERLPGQDGKIQGIDLSKPDAYSRIEEYISSFRRIPLESLEIKRKEYKGSAYTKKQTMRHGVTKRTLETVESEIKISNPAQLKIAKDMMRRGDFESAAKYLNNMLNENPTDGEAYFLRFLTSLSCSNENAFFRFNKTSIDFSDFEKAIACTQDPARRSELYDILYRNVVEAKNLSSYKEYIELPESDAKKIGELTEVMYQLALETRSEQVFDEALKTVTDTDKYIGMNFKFAELFDRTDPQLAMKYYKNILDADEGSAEALWKVFYLEKEQDDQAVLGAFLEGGAAAFEEALFSYGFNAYAHENLFKICLKFTTSRPEDACRLFDYLLSIIPKSEDEIFVSDLHLFVETMLKSGRVNEIAKYNELLLSIDTMDHTAYFYRVLIKHKFRNPFELVNIAGALMDDSDYFSAINSYTEKFPDRNNLYLDISDAVKGLASDITEKKCRKFIADTMYLQKEELVTCKEQVMRCLQAEAQRCFHELCQKYECANAEAFFDLREDITSDPLLLRADLFARVSKDETAELTQHILQDQAETSRKNNAKLEGSIFSPKQRKGLIFTAIACAVAFAVFITLLCAITESGPLFVAAMVLFNFNRSLLRGIGEIGILLLVVSTAVLLLVNFFVVRKRKNKYSYKIWIPHIATILSVLLILIGVGILQWNTVHGIPAYAFQNCSALQSVTIPPNVYWIGTRAFQNCSGLKHAKMSEHVNTIGTSAFAYCTELESITIPKNMYSIGETAFRGCTELRTVIWNATDCAAVGDEHFTTRTSIFADCENLTQVTFLSGVKTIPDYALYGCAWLTSVTIPDTVQEIGDRAFAGCTRLTDVRIGDGVSDIGEQAFLSCSGLRHVTLGSNVSSIGGGLFAGCTMLETIDVAPTNSYYSSQDGILYQQAMNGTEVVGERTIIYVPYAFWGDVRIPNDVRSIWTDTFRSLNGLTSVTIGSGVNRIMEGAFRDCNGLTSVTIGSGVTQIENYAFINCINLKNIRYNGKIDDWKLISLGTDWLYGLDDYTIVCTDGTINKDGTEIRN